MSKVYVVTSGKGGVGKSTSSISIAAGLARAGHKTVVIDFDIGLRNLDALMGMEARVVFDIIDVIRGRARLNQALLQDKHDQNLWLLPASQTATKDDLTQEGVEKIINELKEMGFDFIICDSPAGIEQGALLALYFADEAIITTNPEASSVSDADRMAGFVDAKTRHAEKEGQLSIPKHLLITRYSPERVNAGEMMSKDTLIHLLALPLIGVIPESKDVLTASNQGIPVIRVEGSNAGEAYQDMVDRLLGKNPPWRFLETEKKGFLERLFGRK